jgi:hypothetical protein
VRHKSKEGAEKRKGEGDNAGARYGMRAAQATNSRAFALRGVASAGHIRMPRARLQSTPRARIEHV